MLPALLAGIGLPLLMKLVGAGLEAVDHPLAKAARSGLDEVRQALDEGAIPAKALAEANRHLEAMTALEVAGETAALAQINASLRAEVRSEDAFVRRWRPTFGYAVAITWSAQMAALTYAIVATPETAGEILAAMTHLSVIWGVALSVLGINVVKRSADKALAAAKPPEDWARRLSALIRQSPLFKPQGLD